MKHADHIRYSTLAKYCTVGVLLFPLPPLFLLSNMRQFWGAVNMIVCDTVSGCNVNFEIEHENF